MPDEKIITRTMSMLSFDLSVEEIRDALMSEDKLTEYQVFLAVKAAQLLLKDKE